MLVNINFPDCAPDEVEGVAVTEQGKRNQELAEDRGAQRRPRQSYYWIAFAAAAEPAPGHGTDLRGAGAQMHSVTPLRLDLTDEPSDAPRGCAEGPRARERESRGVLL